MSSYASMLMDPAILTLLGLGYTVYVLADKSTLEPILQKNSLASVVGYSELCNELVNPLRYGQFPIKTRFADCYDGPYGLKVYEMVEPASGNWVPMWNNNLHW